MFKTILILFLLYCISARTVFLLKKNENSKCVIEEQIIAKQYAAEVKCLNSIEKIIENVKDNDSIFIVGETLSIKELDKLSALVKEKTIFTFENNEINVKTKSIEESNKLQESRFDHPADADTKKKPHLYTIYIRYNKIVE
jgi:hypothetical protein